MQQHAGDALQRSAFRAAGALAPCNTAHLVALIEGDDTVEILARPIEQLLQAGGVLTLAAKGRVGDEQDPFAKRNRLIDLPVGKRLNVGGKAADCAPVAARVFEQALVLRDPDGLAASRKPAIKDAGRDLPALPRPRAIAKEIAFAVGAPMLVQLQANALFSRDKQARQILLPRVPGIDDSFDLGLG